MKISLELKKYFLYFLMYSFLGWLYEVFLEVVVYRWGFSDRGVLFGPYCVIYGVGALLFIICLDKLVKYKGSKVFSAIKLIIVFVSCVLIATTIELVASYALEFFTGSWPWQTYADYNYNFQARIALSPSIRFGLGGLAFLYIVQPIFEKVLFKLSGERIDKLFKIFFTILIVDVLLTVIFTFVI